MSFKKKQMDHSFPSNLVSPLDELLTQSRLQNRSNRRSSKDSVGISEIRAAMSGDKSAVIGVIIGLPTLPLVSKRRQKEPVAAPSSQDLFAIAAHRQSWSWATSLTSNSHNFQCDVAKPSSKRLVNLFSPFGRSNKKHVVETFQSSA